MLETTVEQIQTKVNQRVKKETSAIVFYVIAVIFVSILALLCVLPFIMLISGSFSNNTTIMEQGYSLLPRDFSLYAYETIFDNPIKIIRAYSVTVSVTAIGTLIASVLIAMTAYVLSRPDFKQKESVSFFIYFTTLFSGGVIPWYIMTTQVIGLKNNLAALIIPGLMSAFYIFLFKNFLKSVPHELVESAKLDGAGEFRIFWTIILPLTKPAIATIALFSALHYWNDWFTASLLINNDELYPLQYVLFRMLANASTIVDTSVIREEPIPGETMKLAMAIITTGPVLLFYPFAQKYFVTGLTVGGVKG